MKLGRAACAAGAVIAGVLVLAPGAGASTGSSEKDGDDHTTVLAYDVTFRPMEQNYVDLGTPGPGIGDQLVFQDELRQQGRPVGVEGGACTITALLTRGFQTHCVGTVQLADGQIAFQGLVTDAPVKPLAVVGGTGRYRGAGGEATLVETGQDEKGTLTIRLLRLEDD